MDQRHKGLRWTLFFALVFAGCGDDSTPLDGGLGDAQGDIADGGHVDGGLDGGGTDGAAPVDGGVDAFVPRGSIPYLHRFRIGDGPTDRLYFDSSEPLSGTTTDGFALHGRTFVAMHIEPDSTTGHYLSVGEAFDFWDNDALRYEGGSDLRDADGNPIALFSLSYVENTIDEPAAPEERYVTTEATGGGDGLSEEDAWTIEEAFDQAGAGTTVWIKAGDYGNVNLRPSNNGEEDRPIKFIGYRESPGDVTELYYSHGDGDLDANALPLLNGGDRTDGVAIALRSSRNLIFRHLQIEGYRYGLVSQSGSSTHILVDSLLVSHVGGTVPRTEGNAIHFKGDGDNNHNRVSNCLVINASFEAIWTDGDHNLLSHNTVICDETTTREAGTDYYLAVRGIGNVITHSRAERIGDVMHGGHAMGSKAFRTPSEYNLVAHSVARGFSGESFYWAYPMARFNVTKHCISEGDARENNGNLSYKARDGASHNLFESSISFHSSAAIVIEDSVEEDNNGLASNNTWRNIVGYDSVYAIRATTSYNNPSAGPSTDTYSGNRIEHCTFFDTDSTIRNSAVSENNVLINSIFVQTGQYLRSRTDVAGWLQSHNRYHDVEFEVPEGEGNILMDPSFVDTDAGDFRLAPMSPLIDEAAPTASTLDFDGVPRPQGEGADIGAFEFVP